MPDDRKQRLAGKDIMNERVVFVAAEPNLLACTSVDRGSGFEQIEDAPEYRG